MTRRVAVSGAASGIGRALAGMLTERGEEVIGIDRADTDVCADLSRPAERRDAATRVLAQCAGVLDAVVACAGLSEPSPAVVGVNYFGVTELVETLRPALAAARWPRAAVVGSISGTQPCDPDVVAACLHGDEPTALHLAAEAAERGDARRLYPSSKAALAQWARRTCVAPGWADAGIPLNVVAPGVVRTPMSEPLFADERMRRAMHTAVPMPLNGPCGPEAVAGALAWLVSPDNTHLTGQVIYLDGGAEATLRGPEVY